VCHRADRSSILLKHIGDGPKTDRNQQEFNNVCSSMFRQCAFFGSLRNCETDNKFLNRILTRNTEWKTLGDVSTDGWIILKHIVKCIRDGQFIDRWSYFHLFKKSSVLYISYQTTIKYNFVSYSNGVGTFFWRPGSSNHSGRL
jgi:hypothetical protein